MGRTGWRGQSLGWYSGLLRQCTCEETNGTARYQLGRQGHRGLRCPAGQCRTSGQRATEARTADNPGQ